MLAVGDTGLCVELGDGIAPQVHQRVLALDAALRTAAWPGVVETVPAYRSLLIHFDPLRISPQALRARVAALQPAPDLALVARRRWTLPVCYQEEFAPDLAELAARAGLAVEQAIALHAAVDYRVYFLGFAPGFAYLGGLDPRLATPRRSQPRPAVAPGSVAIGGTQTGVLPMVMPSGWHLVGRTPARLFDIRLVEPCLLQPGDVVRFAPMERVEFADLEARAVSGTWRPAAEELP